MRRIAASSFVAAALSFRRVLLRLPAGRLAKFLFLLEHDLAEHFPTQRRGGRLVDRQP
jgi:hypothetical protein